MNPMDPHLVLLIKNNEFTENPNETLDKWETHLEMMDLDT
jgi:hypothetical protein